jgi:hypothetical protein
VQARIRISGYDYVVDLHRQYLSAQTATYFIGEVVALCVARVLNAGEPVGGSSHQPQAQQTGRGNRHCPCAMQERIRRVSTVERWYKKKHVRLDH